MYKPGFHLSRVVKFFAAAIAGLALICVLGLWGLHQYPSIGAYGSDWLRAILGDQVVASIETVMYQVQDSVNQTEYHLGLLHPTDPFHQAGSAPIPQTGGSTSGPAAADGSSNQPSLPAASSDPAKQHLSVIPPANGAARSATKPQARVQMITQSQPQAKVNPTAWTLPQIRPNGTQPDEGVWQPYINNAAGQVVAYRTFVQPDPNRPYVTVGIVAFDLHAVRLHYQIGTEEPYAAKDMPKQSGMVPPADMSANVLLAAFNGGFKYRHGHFGSMLNGFTSSPMRDGLGAVAIYKDGTVKIGQWGKDITDSPNLVAVRENGPLAIQDGQISALVDTPNFWGYTLSGGTVTWRSGIAISADGRTLYYFAGPSLSAPSLANAMMSVHPQSAMQLDINDYWVHFSAIQTGSNQQLEAVPLFPKLMKDGTDRFLRPYIRDFFYVTASPNS